MTKRQTFQMDPIGCVTWTLDETFVNISKISSTVYCYFLALLWKIKIGTGCKFYGVTHFKRYPCSEITIGNQCIFRSSFRSNFVGLNRACGISTHAKTAEIIIGNDSGFSGASIAALEHVCIGDTVLIGANTVITDFDWHSVSGLSNRMASAPVLIENNVWIGMNCVILKGVHIGKGTIVGANSVVTRSLPEMVIATGSPARVIKEIHK